VWSAPARHGEPTQIAEGQIDKVVHIVNRWDIETPIGIARRAVGGPLIDPQGRVVGVPIWIPFADSPTIVSAQHITELVNRHSVTTGNR
jgi:hypothetical protein